MPGQRVGSLTATVTLLLHSRVPLASAAEAECAADGAAQQPLRWRTEAYSGGGGQVYGGKLTLQAFANASFEGPVVDHTWDLLFTHRPMSKLLRQLALPVRPVRLLNHCEYFLAAGHKCRLARHIARVQRSGRFRHLQTFELHEEAQVQAWRRSMREEPGRLWLLKPCVTGKSEGILFISREEDAAAHVGTWAVLQEYVGRPYLFGGHKFHLRLYVLATRWDLPGVLLYDEGLIFRSRHAYNGARPSPERDIFSAVSQNVEALPLTALWREIGATAAVVVRGRIRALLAEVLGLELHNSFGDPYALALHGFSCFDLFGADVMLDEDLEPLLLEVNQGPNIWVETELPREQPLLREVKSPLIAQLARWAAGRVRTPPYTREAAEVLERQTLTNFTRII